MSPAAWHVPEIFSLFRIERPWLRRDDAGRLRSFGFLFLVLVADRMEEFGGFVRQRRRLDGRIDPAIDALLAPRRLGIEQATLAHLQVDARQRDLIQDARPTLE